MGLNASGGGVSAVFPRPAWQSTIPSPDAPAESAGPRRLVPDWSAHSDPTEGYSVRTASGLISVGGTSAVVPLLAGFLARIIELRNGKRLGHLPPLLYPLGKADGHFTDIVKGNNDHLWVPGFPAVPSWDACTGLGTPVGPALVQSLVNAPAPSLIPR